MVVSGQVCAALSPGFEDELSNIYGLPWYLRPAIGRPGFNPWVGKILWRRKWQPVPGFFPGESHGQRSLADYSPRCRTQNLLFPPFYLYDTDPWWKKQCLSLEVNLWTKKMNSSILKDAPWEAELSGSANLGCHESTSFSQI